ncbi:C4-dicarboxylate ABC transporter substrate-binding protein [Clostridiaceae bacterium]|nr:C4-dicarboxylate ABC transporter substrate-binding protein [Clostridiaceae bacterium]RKI15292.1 C4-dicarboxylate ABC transporter substrate-binding protein [bacterium 1XD21-70]
MKRRQVLASILAGAAVMLCACSNMPGMGNVQQETAEAKAEDGAAADGGKVYELKISTSQTEQSLITRNYQKLADELNARSDGRLKVTVFPAGQLGSDEDVLEQAIQGANVAVNTDASRMGQYEKDFSILMMGYFADDYDECFKVTQTDTFKGWCDTLSKDHGIKILSFAFYDGPRQFMTNKPIQSPEDLKGLRIRTIGQEVCTETIQAMGATPISMSWGEVYNGIQSKALEGCEVQNTSSYPSRIYEVCKYQSKTGHFQLMQGLVCGQGWFESLPEDLQKLLEDTANEIGKETAADVMSEVEEAEKKMVEAGLEINEPDLEPFKAAVDPVYEKLGYSELREKLYKEIGKSN